MVDLDLLAYLETFLTEERKRRFKEVLQFRTNFITVATEDVFQMHNSSAIIRSCDAFGIQQVHLIEGRYGKRIDKNIALGAEKWVDKFSYVSSKDCIQNLRNRGYTIVATAPEADGVSLEDFVIKDKTAIFFGTEKEGLSPDIFQEADSFLQIPMVGFTESLNVSVSAAIVLQKLTEDLRVSELPWQLDDHEILAKRLDWTKKTINDVEQIIERFRLRYSTSSKSE